RRCRRFPPSGRPWGASAVGNLLRLFVPGHVEGAVPREKIHGPHGGKPVLVDGGQGRLLAFPEKRGLLVGTQLNLPASVDGHSCTSPPHGRWHLSSSDAGLIGLTVARSAAPRLN